MLSTSVSGSRLRFSSILGSIAAAAILTGCNANSADSGGVKLGRAEALYKSLGGPGFVGADGGTSTKPVYDWFDAHYELVAKFDGKDGVCNGYQPAAGPMQQRERTVCAGAAHSELNKMFEQQKR